MKVLHVASAASVFPRFRLPILEAQRALGHRVEVACRGQPQFLDAIRNAGFPLHVLDLPRHPYPVHTARGLLQLSRLLRAGAYDLVHLHQSMGVLLGVLAAAAAGHRTLFYTTGGLHSHDGMHRVTRPLVSRMERALLARVQAVFSVNQEDVDYAVRMGIAEDRVHLAGPRGGCGIRTDLYRPPADVQERAAARRALHLPASGVPVVGIVARVEWEKGYRELLEAFARIPPVDGTLPILVAAGDGRALPRVQAWVERRGWGGRVRLLGNRADVPQILRALDLFVLPSYREGMPVALLEAMATGLPAIATSVRGSREAVEDGRNGLLVPPGDPAALTAAMARVLGDRALAGRLGSAARADAEHLWSEDVVLPRFMAKYEALAARFVSHAHRGRRIQGGPRGG